MDKEIFDLIQKEQERQIETIELIASENFVSEDVQKAMGSCLTNKYAEGYPGKRYYGGCENVDAIEELCKKRWQQAFNTNYHVNVQPHSGANANLATMMAFLKPGDKILTMSLENGGHLSHGSPVNISGKIFEVIHYGVDSAGLIDYNEFYRKVSLFHPDLILAGASAYPRKIKFDRMYAAICQIKKSCPDYNPIFMVDMAHIAGLVISGDHPSPFGLADVITTTTHKTLRGPRGGMIFCKPEYAKKIDSAVFPGTQGGPLEHIIAAKAVAAKEACEPEFKEYIHNVVINCKAMANEFIRMGYDVITYGTDNHLFLINFSKTHPNMSGKFVQDGLDKIKITLNKNCVPGEKRSPMQASGVRIGTAAMTTAGYNADDFVFVAHVIDNWIKENYKNAN